MKWSISSLFCASDRNVVEAGTVLNYCSSLLVSVIICLLWLHVTYGDTLCLVILCSLVYGIFSLSGPKASMPMVQTVEVHSNGLDLTLFSENMNLRILSFGTPEELVTFSLCSQRAAILAVEPRLWEAHGARFCRWLTDRNLLPSSLCGQLLEFDDKEPRSSSCDGQAFSRRWGPNRFFMLRLGWRDLVVRCALHSKASFGPSLMVVVHRRVFDLTDFGLEHPGSPEILRNVAGCDATLRFDSVRHSFFAQTYMDQFELQETRRASTKARTALQWPWRSQCSTTSNHGLDSCAVPKHVHDAWANTQTCVQKRWYRNCSSSCEDAASSIATTAATDAARMAKCPHCRGRCREAEIFFEWMGARQRRNVVSAHEGRTVTVETNHLDEHSDQSDDLAEVMSVLPRWDVCSGTSANTHHRRLLRNQLRQRRAEKQQNVGGVRAGFFASSAPAGTLQ